MFRARHLPEDRLLDCYLAEQTAEPIEPPAAEHLADCAACAARYAELRRFMNGLRSEADAELDDVFPADMFRAQQQSILRRVEHLAHPARVISFPGHPPGHPAKPARPRVAPRWLGAAAAAGLFVGVVAGSLLYSGGGSNDETPVAATVAPAAEPRTAAASSAERPTDLNELNEQFLSELEIALERPHTPELVAIDDLTPHVREVRLQLR
jgi:anti-sigma factor RsiW